MKFCSKCFQYNEIINIVESNNKKGNCDLQESHQDVFICDTDSDLQIVNLVKNVLLEIIYFYTINSALPFEFSEELKLPLWDALDQKWPIFNLNSINIQTILRILFESDEYFDQGMFTEKVGILKEDEDYDDYLIVQNNNWDTFTRSLKFENRFHTDHLRLKKLKTFIINSKRTIKPGDTIFFRARKSNDTNKPLQIEDMPAPSRGTSTPGRLNAEGISLLYLCTKTKTSIKEVRASFEDNIFIGEFLLKRPISVVDLTRFDESSLFSNNDSENLLSYYFNQDTLIKIAKELSRPTNASSNAVTYIPTQYISDYIKSTIHQDNKTNQVLFDGILYRSTMDSDGLNLALFDPGLAECVNLENFKVNNIDYTLEQLS